MLLMRPPPQAKINWKAGHLFKVVDEVEYYGLILTDLSVVMIPVDDASIGNVLKQDRVPAEAVPVSVLASIPQSCLRELFVAGMVIGINLSLEPGERRD